MPVITIPDYGDIEFPDETPPEEIARTIRAEVFKLDPVPESKPDDQQTEMYRRDTVAKNLSVAGRDLEERAKALEALKQEGSEIDRDSLDAALKGAQFAGSRYRTALEEFDNVQKANPTGFWQGLGNTAAKATGVFSDIGIKSTFDEYAKNARAARTWEQKAAEDPDGEHDSPFDEVSGPIESLVSSIFGTREKMKAGDIAGEYNRFASGALEKLKTETPAYLEKRAALASAPQSRTMEEYNKTQGAVDAIKFASRHPIEVPTNVAVQGLVSSVPGLVLGAVGSLAGGPAGLAYGAGTGSALVEDASKFADMLEEGGYDSPEKVMELVKDPAKLDSMRDTAAKRGLAVGTFDALSGAIAGKLVAGASGATRGARALSVAGRAGADIATQGAFGGAGELFGQLAAGEKIDTKAIFEEIIGELPTGAIETGVGFRGHVKEAAENELVGLAKRAGEAGMPNTAKAAEEASARAKAALDTLANEKAPAPQAKDVEGAGKEEPPAASSQAASEVPPVAPAAPALGEEIDYSEFDTGGGQPSLSEREDNTPDPIPHTESEVTGVPIEYEDPKALELSQDLPQFKKGANAKGVVKPLPGTFDETGTGPIQVWRRKSGKLEVISGRHRLELAQRSNAPRIAMQVHDEAAGFDLRQAARLDAELNIRDENGSAADYANYFKDSELSEEDANQRGLLERPKGRAGFAIARGAGENVFGLHQSGGLTDAEAEAIANAAPGNDGAQAVGVRAIKDGKSALFAGNLVKAATLRAAQAESEGAQGDLFGFDDSAMRAMEEQAKIAGQAQADLRERIRSIEGSAKKPEVARKEGLPVDNPEALRQRVKELRAELERWRNWPMHADLVAKTRGTEAVSETKPPETPVKAPETGKKLEGIALAFNGDILAQGPIGPGNTHAKLKKAALAKLLAIDPNADPFDIEHGFVDENGNFVSRSDAWPIAKAAGLIDPELAARKEAKGKPSLESQDLKAPAKPAAQAKPAAAAPTAKNVLESATKVPTEKRFGGGFTRKVYLADVWRQWQQDTGSTMSLADFQKALLPMMRNGDLALTRADFIPENLIPGVTARTAESEFNAGGEEKFHFIELPEEKKPAKAPAKAPEPEAAKPDAAAVHKAYTAERDKAGFSHVLISDLQKASGVPLAQLKAWLREESKAGRAHLARGDWSLSSPEAREASIEIGGEAQLRVKLDPPKATEPTPGKVNAPQSDIFSGRADEPFNLVGETAKEREARIAREMKEEAQKKAAAEEIARAQQEKNQRRLFDDEAGGIPLSVIEDALPTVLAVARELFTAGTNFYRWAGSMVRRLGAVVSPLLRQLWRSVSGQNIPPARRERGSLGSTAGSSFRQAQEGQSNDPEKKRAQVFGEAGVGHEYEVRKVAQVQEAIRAIVFDGTGDQTAANSEAAWKLAHSWANPDTAYSIAGWIRDVGGNELAPGIAQGELMRYARRMAAAGDPSLEAFMHAYSNLFPMAVTAAESDAAAEAVGASAAGALLNGRRWLMSPSSRVVVDVAKERDDLAGEAVGDSTILQIRRVLLTLNISADELLDAISAIKSSTGENLGDILNRIIATGQLVEDNPMLTAIVQMARDAYNGLSDFEFRTMDREEKDIRASLSPVLANIRQYLEKKGAQGLERDWWQALAGPRDPEGPLYTADKALQGQLSAILRETMRQLGLITEAEAATLTDAEKVAMTLGKQELREGKIELVDKRVTEEIDSRLEAEIAAIEADDTLSDEEREGQLEAIVAHYEMLRDAWEEATANMKGQPASKATVRRMLYLEAKGTKWNDVFRTGTQARVAETAVAAVLKKIKAASASHTAGLDYGPIETLLKEQMAAIVAKKAARFAANEEAKRVRRAAREAGKPERQATTILDQFAKRQSDTPDFGTPISPNKVRVLVDGLVRAMNAGFFPSEEAFIREAQAHGVEAETARKLFSVAEREHKAAEIGKTHRETLRAAERGSLEPLIASILATPLHQQLNPAWRKQAALDYFKNSGLSDAAAEAAATAFASTFTERLAEAREKAAELAVRSNAKWKEKVAKGGTSAKRGLSDLDKIKRAVRAGATDPKSDFAAELAKARGWKGFSEEQNQRLAELDAIMEDDSQPEHERVRAGNEMLSIARRANVSPSIRRTLAASVAMNILSGLSSILINVTSPMFFAARKFLVDSTIGGSPVVAFRGMAQRFRSWFGEFIYAMKNDSYTFGWHEHLDTSGTALEQWLQDGLASVREGNPAGIVKLFFGLPDLVRRVHQSLDQAGVAQENDYSKMIFTMEAAKEAGLSNAEVHQLLSIAALQQEQAFEGALEAGASRTEARVYALEAFRNTLSYAVGEINPEAAASLDDASKREGFTIVGRRDTAHGSRELSEGTAVSRGIDATVGSISRLEEVVMRAHMDRNKRESTLAAVQVIKRMVFGFIRVPWRVSHFLLGDMPLVGTWRAAMHRWTKGRGEETPYAQTWGTAFQERARIRELMANTALVAVAAALYRPSDEDDDDKGDFFLTVTGGGPTSEDRGYKAAWGRQNKPWAMRGKLFGVPFEVNLGRGAEAFLYQFAPFMAWDDYQVRTNQNRGRRAPKELTAWAELAANYMSTLWQRVGVANQFGRTANVFSRDTYTAQNAVGWVSGFAKNLAPVQRLVESGVQLLEGQSDTSTVENVLKANTPYIGPLLGEPAINSLGDEIADDAGSKIWKAGVPFMVRVKDSPANQLVYGMILEKGQSPPAPMRKTVEQAYGRMSDPRWRAYMKHYGAAVKAQMVDEYDDLRAMAPADFNDRLNTIGKVARTTVEDELSLERLPKESR